VKALHRDEKISWFDASRVICDAGDLDIAVAFEAGAGDAPSKVRELHLTLRIIGS